MGRKWQRSNGDGTVTRRDNETSEIVENNQRLIPTWIMDDVMSISAGQDFSIAIRGDGSLWAWGANTTGQVGIGAITRDAMTGDAFNSSPTRIMDDVVAVSAGWYHTLAIRSDGSLWSWGSNIFGQIGDGTTINHYSPVRIMDNVMLPSVGGRQAQQPISQLDPPPRPPSAPVAWAVGAPVTTALTGQTIPAAMSVGGVLAVSACVVAENILGTQTFWDAATGRLTLASFNAQGQQVTLVTHGNNPFVTITVDGYTRMVDIAEEMNRLAGESHWAAGYVTPAIVDGNIFLPVRLVFDLFEIPFTWDSVMQALIVG